MWSLSADAANISEVYLNLWWRPYEGPILWRHLWASLREWSFLLCASVHHPRFIYTCTTHKQGRNGWLPMNMPCPCNEDWLVILGLSHFACLVAGIYQQSISTLMSTWTQALPKLGLSQKTVHYVLIIPLSLRALGTHSGLDRGGAGWLNRATRAVRFERA